jgi:hypothetical protein
MIDIYTTKKEAGWYSLDARSWPPYQNVSAIAQSSTLSEKANTSVASQALRKALFCCCFKRSEYRFKIERSMVNAETVRNASIASAANWELPEYTSAFRASNSSSYRIRMNAARKMQGRAANTVTRLSFQPKEKAIAMQPIVLQTEIIGKMPFSQIIS